MEDKVFAPRSEVLSIEALKYIEDFFEACNLYSVEVKYTREFDSISFKDKDIGVVSVQEGFALCTEKEINNILKEAVKALYLARVNSYIERKNKNKQFKCTCLTWASKKACKQGCEEEG